MVMEYKEKNKKYTQILKTLNSDLEGLVKRISGDVEKFDTKNMPVSSAAPPSCGSMNKNPFTGQETLTAEEKADILHAQDEVNNIVEQLGKDLIKFPDASKVLPPVSSGAGAERGNREGLIEVPKFQAGEKQWMKRIKSSVGRLFTKPDITKRGIDYESAQTYIEQGIFITKKPTAHSVKRDKEIYVLLDQSYSMESYTYKGFNFLQLLGSFIPDLAEEYSGWFWGCDVCSEAMFESNPEDIPGVPIKLQDIKAKTLRGLPYKGGGGTRFGGAFMKLKGKELERQQTNPDYEMCVLFFSDMDLDTSDWGVVKKYAPERTMFITAKPTNYGEIAIPDNIQQWIDNSPKREILLINLQ